MNDEEFSGPDRPERRLEVLAQEFGQLSPEDQALVMALVARLREPVEQHPGYAPDVAFMDFDE